MYGMNTKIRESEFKGIRRRLHACKTHKGLLGYADEITLTE